MVGFVVFPTMYHHGAGRRGRCKYPFWCNDIDIKNLELGRKFDVLMLAKVS
jgi:hypothetical protein